MANRRSKSCSRALKRRCRRRVPGQRRANHRCDDRCRAPAAQHRRRKARHQGGRIPGEWANKPAKLRQKDRDARWTVKYTKAKRSAEGAPRVDLAIPAFGYKNHIAIDRWHGLIRTWTTTDASRHDGAVVPALIDKNNTASEVWADTAYRSQANEVSRRPSLAFADPPQEGQADASAQRPRQQSKVQGAGRDRACVCPPERANGPVHPHPSASLAPEPKSAWPISSTT